MSCNNGMIDKLCKLQHFLTANYSQDVIDVSLTSKAVYIVSSRIKCKGMK